MIQRIWCGLEINNLGYTTGDMTKIKGVEYSCPHCEDYWKDEMLLKYWHDIAEALDAPLELCCPLCEKEEGDEG
jgi:hypothetical protein